MKRTNVTLRDTRLVQVKQLHRVDNMPNMNTTLRITMVYHTSYRHHLWIWPRSHPLFEYAKYLVLFTV